MEIFQQSTTREVLLSQKSITSDEAISMNFSGEIGNDISLNVSVSMKATTSDLFAENQTNSKFTNQHQNSYNNFLPERVSSRCGEGSSTSGSEILAEGFDNGHGDVCPADSCDDGSVVSITEILNIGKELKLRSNFDAEGRNTIKKKKKTKRTLNRSSMDNVLAYSKLIQKSINEDGYCYGIWLIEAKFSFDELTMAFENLGKYPLVEDVFYLLMKKLDHDIELTVPQVKNGVMHIDFEENEMKENFSNLLQKHVFPKYLIGGKDDEDHVPMGKARSDVLRTLRNCNFDLDALKKTTSKRLVEELVAEGSGAVLLDVMNDRTGDDSNKMAVGVNFTITMGVSQFAEKYFPEFKLVETKDKSGVNPHAKAYIQRVLGMRTMFHAVVDPDLKSKQSHENKLTRDKANTYKPKIIDVGGNRVMGLNLDYSNYHACCPIIDPRDSTRYNSQNDSFQAKYAKQVISKTLLENFTKPGSNAFPGFCTNLSEDCSIKADVAFFVFSSGDMSMTTIGRILDSHEVDKAYMMMMYDPEIVIARAGSRGKIPEIDVTWKVDECDDNNRPLITFMFLNDTRFAYTHDLENYQLQLVTNYIVTPTGKFYLVENFRDVGGSIIRSAKIVDRPTYSDHVRLRVRHEFNANKGKVRIEGAKVTDMNFTGDVKMMTKKETYVVDEFTFTRIMSYFLRAQEGSFTFQSGLNYILSSSFHITLNGTDVIPKELVVQIEDKEGNMSEGNIEALFSLVINLYSYAYSLRNDAALRVKDAIGYIKDRKESNELTATDLVKHVLGMDSLSSKMRGIYSKILSHLSDTKEKNNEVITRIKPTITHLEISEEIMTSLGDDCFRTLRSNYEMNDNRTLMVEQETRLGKKQRDMVHMTFMKAMAKPSDTTTKEGEKEKFVVENDAFIMLEKLKKSDGCCTNKSRVITPTRKDYSCLYDALVVSLGLDECFDLEDIRNYMIFMALQRFIHQVKPNIGEKGIEMLVTPVENIKSAGTFSLLKWLVVDVLDLHLCYHYRTMGKTVSATMGDVTRTRVCIEFENINSTRIGHYRGIQPEIKNDLIRTVFEKFYNYRDREIRNLCDDIFDLDVSKYTLNKVRMINRCFIKLLDILDKNAINISGKILEVGGAPGGFLSLLTSLGFSNITSLSIDSKFAPERYHKIFDGSPMINYVDFLSDETVLDGKYDTLICDMADDEDWKMTRFTHITDRLEKYTAQGANLILKIHDVFRLTKNNYLSKFRQYKMVKPLGSRLTNSEVYFIGMNYDKDYVNNDNIVKDLKPHAEGIRRFITVFVDKFLDTNKVNFKRNVSNLVIELKMMHGNLTSRYNMTGGMSIRCDDVVKLVLDSEPIENDRNDDLRVDNYKYMSLNPRVLMQKLSNEKEKVTVKLHPRQVKYVKLNNSEVKGEVSGSDVDSSDTVEVKKSNSLLSFLSISSSDYEKRREKESINETFKYDIAKCYLRLKSAFPKSLDKESDYAELLLKSKADSSKINKDGLFKKLKNMLLSIANSDTFKSTITSEFDRVMRITYYFMRVYDMHKFNRFTLVSMSDVDPDKRLMTLEHRYYNAVMSKRKITLHCDKTNEEIIHETKEFYHVVERIVSTSKVIDNKIDMVEVGVTCNILNDRRTMSATNERYTLKEINRSRIFTSRTIATQTEEVFEEEQNKDNDVINRRTDRHYKIQVDALVDELKRQMNNNIDRSDNKDDSESVCEIIDADKEEDCHNKPVTTRKVVFNGEKTVKTNTNVKQPRRDDDKENKVGDVYQQMKTFKNLNKTNGKSTKKTEFNLNNDDVKLGKIRNDVKFDETKYHKVIFDKIVRLSENPKELKIEQDLTGFSSENEIVKNECADKTKKKTWAKALGDGSCLFHAMSMAAGFRMTGLTYRIATIYTLITNPEYIELIDQSNYKDLINGDYMRCDFYHILAKIENLNICLHKDNEAFRYYKSSRQSDFTLHIYHKDNHYDYAFTNLSLRSKMSMPTKLWATNNIKFLKGPNVNDNELPDGTKVRKFLSYADPRLLQFNEINLSPDIHFETDMLSFLSKNMEELIVDDDDKHVGQTSKKTFTQNVSNENVDNASSKSLTKSEKIALRKTTKHDELLKTVTENYETAYGKQIPKEGSITQKVKTRTRFNSFVSQEESFSVTPSVYDCETDSNMTKTTRSSMRRELNIQMEKLMRENERLKEKLLEKESNSSKRTSRKQSVSNKTSDDMNGTKNTLEISLMSADVELTTQLISRNKNDESNIFDVTDNNEIMDRFMNDVEKISSSDGDETRDQSSVESIGEISKVKLLESTTMITPNISQTDEIEEGNEEATNLQLDESTCEERIVDVDGEMNRVSLKDLENVKKKEKPTTFTTIMKKMFGNKTKENKTFEREFYSTYEASHLKSNNLDILDGTERCWFESDEKFSIYHSISLFCGFRMTGPRYALQVKISMGVEMDVLIEHFVKHEFDKLSSIENIHETLNFISKTENIHICVLTEDSENCKNYGNEKDPVLVLCKLKNDGYGGRYMFTYSDKLLNRNTNMKEFSTTDFNRLKAVMSADLKVKLQFENVDKWVHLKVAGKGGSDFNELDEFRDVIAVVIPVGGGKTTLFENVGRDTVFDVDSLFDVKDDDFLLCLRNKALKTDDVRDWAEFNRMYIGKLKLNLPTKGMILLHHEEIARQLNLRVIKTYLPNEILYNKTLTEVGTEKANIMKKNRDDLLKLNVTKCFYENHEVLARSIIEEHDKHMRDVERIETLRKERNVQLEKIFNGILDEFIDNGEGGLYETEKYCCRLLYIHAKENLMKVFENHSIVLLSKECEIYKRFSEQLGEFRTLRIDSIMISVKKENNSLIILLEKNNSSELLLTLRKYIIRNIKIGKYLKLLTTLTRNDFLIDAFSPDTFVNITLLYVSKSDDMRVAENVKLRLDQYLKVYTDRLKLNKIHLSDPAFHVFPKLVGPFSDRLLPLTHLKEMGLLYYFSNSMFEYRNIYLRESVDTMFENSKAAHNWFKNKCSLIELTEAVKERGKKQYEYKFDHIQYNIPREFADFTLYDNASKKMIVSLKNDIKYDEDLSENFETSDERDYGCDGTNIVKFNKTLMMYENVDGGRCDTLVVTNKAIKMFLDYPMMKKLEKINPLRGKMPLVTVRQGPPGCGKSEYIVRMFKDGDLVLTTTRAGRLEIIEKLNFHKKNMGKQFNSAPEKSVKTISSFLLNDFSLGKINTLFIDEALMNHGGSCAFAAMKSDCNHMILVGDVHQISFIDRIGVGLKHLSPCQWTLRKSVTNRTYRCPIDATEYMRRFTDHKDVYTMNKVTKSIYMIETLDKIPSLNKKMNDVLFLTFTQSEKQQLRDTVLNNPGLMSKYGFGNYKESDINVNTVNEAQGLTRKTIILVRYNMKDIALFDSEDQILVAITRHTELFIYCSRKEGKLGKNIKKLLGIEMNTMFDNNVRLSKNDKTKHDSETFDEKNVNPDLKGGKYESDLMMCRVVQEADAVTLEAMKARDVYTHPVLMPIEIFKRPSQSDFEIPNTNDLNDIGDVSTLQQVYDKFMFSKDIYTRDFQVIIEESEFDRRLDGITMKVDKFVPFDTKRKDYEDLKPNLFTKMEPNRKVTTKEVLHAMTTRNANVPNLMYGGLNRYEVAKRTVENFKRSVFRIDYQKYLDLYEQETFSLNYNLIAAWMKTRDSRQKSETINSEPFETLGTNVYEYSVKPIIKAATDVKKFTEFVGTQSIVSQRNFITVIFAPIFVMIRKRLSALFSDKVLFFSDYDIYSFEDELNKRISPESFRTAYKIENDFSKFDKSQEIVALELDCAIMEMTGVDSHYIDLWRNSHETSKAINRDTGISMNLKYQRRSGDASTYLGNSMYTLASIVALYDVDKIDLILVAGDDSLILTHDESQLSDRSHLFASYFNLEAKLVMKQYSYFCSKFILLIENRIRILPDYMRMITKFGRSDMVNWNHVKDYFTSTKDLLKNCLGEESEIPVSRAIHERYVFDETYPVMNLSPLFRTMRFLMRDEKNFSKLYREEGKINVKANLPRSEFYWRLKRRKTMEDVIEVEGNYDRETF